MEPPQKMQSIEETHVNKRRVALREKADRAKQFRCKTFIVVLENPSNFQNIGTVIRNIDALGAGKLYIVDSRNILPDDWETMRKSPGLMNTSSSAVKWTFCKKFKSSDECFDHLEKKGFVSLVTSPHIKGGENIHNMNLTDANFTKYKNLAIWFGNESVGITDNAVTRASGCLQIDMCGIIESLNLAVCTGIVINMVTSQRRKWFADKIANRVLNLNIEEID